MKMSHVAQSHSLTIEEREAVSQSRRPALSGLSPDDLHSLRARLRDFRDKARTTLYQQRRERKGKSAPIGGRLVTSEQGSAIKERALAAAVKRVNRAASRDRKAQTSSQRVKSEAALQMKRANAHAPTHPMAGMSKSEGFQSLPDTNAPPSGAFDQEGQHPVLKRSHKTR